MSEKMPVAQKSASPAGVGDSAIKQPMSRVFGEVPEGADNPLANERSRIKQPVTTIFGEGNTIGSPDNRSSGVILDPDGNPKGVALRHQQYGYTEAADLTVIRQPITTRFGDPLSKPTLPDLPGSQRKYTGLPARPPFPTNTRKREDRPFLEF